MLNNDVAVNTPGYKDGMNLRTGMAERCFAVLCHRTKQNPIFAQWTEMNKRDGICIVDIDIQFNLNVNCHSMRASILYFNMWDQHTLLWKAFRVLKLRSSLMVSCFQTRSAFWFWNDRFTVIKEKNRTHIWVKLLHVFFLLTCKSILNFLPFNEAKHHDWVL